MQIYKYSYYLIGDSALVDLTVESSVKDFLKEFCVGNHFKTVWERREPGEKRE